MSDTFAHPAAGPYANRVQHVTNEDPFHWLAAGLSDYQKATGASVAYGLVFVVIGLLLLLALYIANMIYLFVPLATGFMLLGPALTVGFYAISRDLERGEKPSLGRALSAFRVNPGPFAYIGFAFLCLFLLWVRLAQLAFALSFPSSAGLDIPSLVNATLLTGGGLVFVAITLAIGGVIAALTFAGGAFALPMLLDRPVGMVEAVATSWNAVVMNLRPMAVWAVLLVLITAAGMACAMVGLAVALPLAGHATWHAYRAVIRP
jgi:uncharacterized membrane protein